MFDELESKREAFVRDIDIFTHEKESELDASVACGSRPRRTSDPILGERHWARGSRSEMYHVCLIAAGELTAARITV